MHHHAVPDFPAPTTEEIAIIQALQAEQQSAMVELKGFRDAYMSTFTEVTNNFLEMQTVHAQNRQLKLVLGMDSDDGAFKQWHFTPACEIAPSVADIPMPRFGYIKEVGHSTEASHLGFSDFDRVYTQSTMCPLHGDPDVSETWSEGTLSQPSSHGFHV